MSHMRNGNKILEGRKPPLKVVVFMTCISTSKIQGDFHKTTVEPT